MGKYEVTQGEWKAVMGDNPAYFSACGDRCPVEQVSWDEVQTFIRRLNQQTGLKYRLPTEQEWYSACQAGTNFDYCGSDSLDEVAWYASNSGGATHLVGEKQANAWSLYDMSGNVFEWTSSCFENECTQRATRGGSWAYKPANLIAFYRFGFRSGHRSGNLGFRLIQEP
jgi:formylglycine-generating enzyme required for sulfatase activity